MGYSWKTPSREGKGEGREGACHFTELEFPEKTSFHSSLEILWNEIVWHSLEIPRSNTDLWKIRMSFSWTAQGNYFVFLIGLCSNFSAPISDFWLNQIQDCSIQIKKMKDEIFSFQLKKKKKRFCQTFTGDARLKNIPPYLDLTRI